MSKTTTVNVKDRYSEGSAHFTNPTRENITTELQGWFVEPERGGVPEGLDGGVADALEDLADAICRHDDTTELAEFLGLKVDVGVEG